MKTGLIVVLMLLGLTVVSFGQDVHYNYQVGTNFSVYKSYQWVDLPAGAVPDQLVDQAIKRSIDEQLAQKGLTKLDKDADLQISYQVIVQIEKGINLNGSGYRDIGGWGSWGTGSIWGQTSSIPVGMLLVNVYDPAHSQLIWRGDATKSIELKKDPEKNYKNLQKVMTKLFKNYPPPTSK